MSITTALLESLHACPDQVVTFRETFSTTADTGVAVSVQNVRLALQAGLDIDWLAHKIFTAPAWAAYEEARATAWVQAYKKSIAYLS